MDKDKRSYFLPDKLVEALDREAKKQGYVREKLIPALGKEDKPRNNEQ